VNGATEAEILVLESTLGRSLPPAYREYLLRSGHDESGPLRGTDCFIRHVIDNNKWLPKLFAGNDVRWTLPERYVCFFMHQGYIAAWFNLDDSHPDPSCWCYREGEMPLPEARGTFSSFMRSVVEACGGTWTDPGLTLDAGVGRQVGGRSAPPAPVGTKRAMQPGHSERRKSRISGSRSTPRQSATRLT